VQGLFFIASANGIAVLKKCCIFINILLTIFENKAT